MSKPAERRARELEAKIVAAIEAGEFVPVDMVGYLAEVAPVEYGPCGCAIGAAAYLAGAPLRSPRWKCVQFAALDEQEARDLEVGYEGSTYYAFGRFIDYRSPFYRAGARLRRFHPNYGGVE